MDFNKKPSHLQILKVFGTTKIIDGLRGGFTLNYCFVWPNKWKRIFQDI